MMLSEIAAQLDQLFKIATAEDVDNVGLLCGNPELYIKGILVCHDALETVVTEAVDKNCNLIISFHPIIFNGLKKISGRTYVEKSIIKALENKIAIYAVHTAWDNDFDGVNRGISNKLGLRDCKILMPKAEMLRELKVYVPRESADKVREAINSAGAGSIGFYDQCSFELYGKGHFRPLPGAHPADGSIGKHETADEVLLNFIFEDYKEKAIYRAMMAAHPYEEVAYQIVKTENKNQYAGLGMIGNLPEEMEKHDFLALVKKIFNLKMIRHSDPNIQTIKKVALLGGSGASGIHAAMSQGADAYLTGDLKYHDFFTAQDNLLLCDIGHYESEQWVCDQLAAKISEKFPKFAVLKSTVNTNPVNYFL